MMSLLMPLNSPVKQDFARVLLEDSRCVAVVLNGLSSNADLTELPFTKDRLEAGAGSPFVPVRDTVGCGGWRGCSYCSWLS